MTGQIADLVLYEGEIYHLLGVDGEKLIKPNDVGINKITSTITACWRGYIRWFAVKNNLLILDQFNVNTNEEVLINGKAPETSSPRRFFQQCYRNLEYQMDFTGRILITKDFLDEMYIHMGFQRPYAFKSILELHFQNGVLTEIKDLSEQMANLRELEDISEDKLPEELKNVIWFWIRDDLRFDY